MKPIPQDSEGWGKAHGSHRVHYFINKDSVCGNYYLRSYIKQGRYAMRRGPQDCHLCWEKLEELGKT